MVQDLRGLSRGQVSPPNDGGGGRAEPRGAAELAAPGPRSERRGSELLPGSPVAFFFFLRLGSLLLYSPQAGNGD